MKSTIKATVSLEGALWVCIFERIDQNGLAVARCIFGKEPTDPELYDYILTHFEELRFTEPCDFTLVIKRKNPKSVQREVRREMANAKANSRLPSTTLAQDVLRLELEKNKKLKKNTNKIEKEAQEQEKFRLRQEKKKKKLRGH